MQEDLEGASITVNPDFKKKGGRALGFKRGKRGRRGRGRVSIRASVEISKDCRCLRERCWKSLMLGSRKGSKNMDIWVTEETQEIGPAATAERTTSYSN